MRGSAARLKMLNDGGPDERWEGPGKNANGLEGPGVSSAGAARGITRGLSFGRG